jgi:hypothetical protein
LPSFTLEECETKMHPYMAAGPVIRFEGLLSHGSISQQMSIQEAEQTEFDEDSLGSGIMQRQASRPLRIACDP